MIKRLAHLCLFTDQSESLLIFYRDVLGFPFVFDMKNSDGMPFGWYLDTGDRTFIEIFDQHGAVREWGGKVTRLRQDNASFYRHMCFEVEGLKALRAELLGNGIEVTKIKRGMDHSYQCWIKDPDGNSIELMEYTDESLQFSGKRGASAS